MESKPGSSSMYTLLFRMFCQYKLYMASGTSSRSTDNSSQPYIASASPSRSTDNSSQPYIAYIPPEMFHKYQPCMNLAFAYKRILPVDTLYHM